MDTQKPFAVRHAKQIEYIFLSIIFLGIAIVVFYGWYYHPRHSKMQAVNRVQTTEMPIDSPEFLLYYNQFWQKFNSTAAISADINHDSIVSQTEVEFFKNKFLSDMNLKPDPNQPDFVINEFNNVVSPERLTCYIKHYDPKKFSKAEVLASC